jgi:hypothetical protein
MTQHPDIAVWVLTGVVAAMGLILWWSIRAWVKGINRQIAEIMQELKVVGNKNIGFEKDIARIDRYYDEQNKRFHDYSERMRGVEQTQAKCRNCNQ